MPLHDVTAMLEHLLRVISCFAAQEGDPFSVKWSRRKKRRLLEAEPLFPAHKACDYRGIESWLDSDAHMVCTRNCGYAVLQACIEWICHTVSAHFTTLVLDKKGVSLSERLLGSVRLQRERIEPQ